MTRGIPPALALAYLAFAWVLGTAAAAFTGADLAASIAAAGLLGAASFAISPRASTLLLLTAGAGLIFLAGWRYDKTSPPSEPTGIARYNDGDAVRFRATVSAEPQDRASWRRYQLSVQEVLIGGEWRPESGGVLMDGSLYPQYGEGDLLEVEGELQTPPSLPDFDYREYLLRQGVIATVSYPQVHLITEGGASLRSTLDGVRARLTGALSDALPEPEASLAAGVLLGARRDIPAGLRDDMNTTGTSHLVAVSGQNVTIVAGMLIAALTWVVGRRRAAWLALAGILAYTALVGAQPSVVRAAIMGALYVMSIAFGRQNTGIVALVLAAAVMLGLEPQLAHDVSFQLSFAGTLGLVLMASPLDARLQTALPAGLRQAPGVRPLVSGFAITLAAIAFTLPITAVNFHRVSIVAPVANLFAVPAFIAVAATAAVTALAGAISPTLGSLTVWVSWPTAAYMVGVAGFFARLPGASVELSGVGAGHAIAYYAALAIACWLVTRKRIEPPKPASPAAVPVRALAGAGAIVGLLALSFLLTWLAATAPTGGRLSITVLDVGQGDAILVQGPRGQRILVDGGPGGQAVTAALGRNLPFDDRRLDLVVLTHPQEDHIGGLPEVLASYSVRGVLTNPYAADTAVFGAWQQALGDAQAPVAYARRGETIDLGDGARLDVLNPPPVTPGQQTDDLNDTSVVLRLTMGGVSFLLTGDLAQAGENALIAAGADLRAQVLKVGHHGSRTSTSPAFLAQVDPVVDVISVGAQNRFGHPTQEVLDRLSDDLLLRTDQNGDVTVSTDGERIWVDRQRTGPEASAQLLAQTAR
jgi:competence protein ComEC